MKCSTSPTRIPIFFAVDDNYVPCLYVALRSLIDHASERYEYKIHILIDTLSEENRRTLAALSTENVDIAFAEVTERLHGLCDRLHIRDYYSKSTYYRFFIPALFPEYCRGLYLDCDLIFNADVARLFFAPLGRNLVAAMNEEVISDIEVFGQYSEQVLKISRFAYFNAGILVMNLSEMRRFRLEERFVKLLGERTFRVAQDQDYLNVLCRGRVTPISKRWNKTPMPHADESEMPFIVHYKINFKPWRYDGIPYASYFWAYADKTPYGAYFHHIKDTYSEGERTRDRLQYEALEAMAAQEVAAALAEEGADAHVLVPVRTEVTL